jgi:TonB family protein
MLAKWIILNIVILFSLQTFAQSQYERFNLDCNKQPLRSVLDEIKTKSGINFIYNDDLVKDIDITCKIKNSSPESIVKEILHGHNLSYRKFGSNYFVLLKEKKTTEEDYKPVVLKEDIPLETGDLSKPILISEVSPVYPFEALKDRIEGKVAVKFFINKDGNVSEVSVESTSGSSILDSAAINYVQMLKFIPAEANGKPRNVWMTMSFQYLFQRN